MKIILTRDKRPFTLSSVFLRDPKSFYRNFHIDDLVFSFPNTRFHIFERSGMGFIVVVEDQNPNCFIFLIRKCQNFTMLFWDKAFSENSVDKAKQVSPFKVYFLNYRTYGLKFMGFLDWDF